MKKVIVLLLCAAMLLSLGACAKKTQEPVSVAALMGPTGMGLAYMMAEQSDTYQVELFNAPDQITGKFISGEADIVAVPVNLASVLYAKTEGDVAVIAVNTLGVLYVLDGKGDLTSIEDLAGKTLYSSGQGSTPEYVLDYLLDAYGLTNQVTVEYVADHTTLAAMLADGSAEYGLLPEPHVSAAMAKSASLRVALDINALYRDKSGNDLVQGCYIVHKSYLAEHADAVSAFLKDCAASVNQVNSSPDAPAVLVEQGIIGNEAVAASAIPNCNVVCVIGSDMRAIVSDTLQVLFDANPASVGGTLPSDDFYASN